MPVARRQCNKLSAMGVEQCVGRHEQGTCAVSSKAGEGTVEFCLTSARDARAAVARKSFLIGSRREERCRIGENANEPGPRHEFTQQLKALGRERGGDKGHAGDAPSRAVETRNETVADRVAAIDEYDGSGRGCRFGRERRQRTTACDNDTDPALDQIGRQRGQAIGKILCRPMFDRNIPALDETDLPARPRPNAASKSCSRCATRFGDSPPPASARCCARARVRPALSVAPPSRAMNSPPPHSITSSARASSEGGTSMPSALQSCILMTSSNAVGCCTGMSAGFSPLSTRPA